MIQGESAAIDQAMSLALAVVQQDHNDSPKDLCVPGKVAAPALSDCCCTTEWLQVVYICH